MVDKHFRLLPDTFFVTMDKKVFTFLYCICLCNYALGLPAVDFLQAITVKKCGTSIFPPSSPDRIVGGKLARHGDYPWIVSLQEDDDSGFEHVCGATVLNENWIITAAHCIDYVHDPSRYQGIVGLHKLSKPGASTVQVIKISKIVIHKDYDDDTMANDIALLKTAKPINIAGSKGYVNGICLPRVPEKDPKGFATVIGWGHTYEDGENSDTLRVVDVPIIPRDLCNESYDDDPFDEFDEIVDTMICAGMKNRDSCQNDSGGPLFQTSSKGVSTLIGVVSHGTGCGEKYYPGVYTKVSSYLSWIEKIVSRK